MPVQPEKAYEEWSIGKWPRFLQNGKDPGDKLGTRMSWTPERCHAAAISYKSRAEFRIKCPGGYFAMLRNNTIGNYPHLQRVK